MKVPARVPARTPVTLHRRLQLLGILPALILLLLLLGLLTWQRFGDADTELRNRGEFVAEHLAAASEYGILSGNRADLLRQARHAFRDPDLRKVVFRDARGRELLREEAPNLEQREDGEGVMRFSAGIYRQPAVLGRGEAPVASRRGHERAERIGEVTIALSDHRVAARQREILLTSMGPALVAVLVALVIARRMSGNISAPLQQLSGLLRMIREGDYEVRGAADLQGELATLQDDINELASHLERARSEQDAAMAQLREERRRSDAANQAKSEFLAMMSHELRTPMNGVLGMLQLMDTTNLDEEQREYVRGALESTTHLMEVINDILDFSRIESRRLGLEELYFSPAGLIEGCVMNFRHLAEQKGLRLELHGLEQLLDIQVRSDPTRLRQILANLVSNAVKFTEHGGVDVEVSLAPGTGTRQRLEIGVRDTGPGIPPDRRQQLFEPFSQLDSSTSRRHGGAGLGLAISHRLAELLGGELDVWSRQGEGTRFMLRLELPARSGTDEPDTSEPPPLRLHGRVLLVEDNDVNRMVVERMLRGHGLEVHSVRNGREALDLLATEPVDAVLMDVQMPVMDGLSATRHLRERERQQGQAPIPVIALTANALAGERERCLAAGMDDYVAKPFRREQLVEVLSRYLPGGAVPG